MKTHGRDWAHHSPQGAGDSATLVFPIPGRRPTGPWCGLMGGPIVGRWAFQRADGWSRKILQRARVSISWGRAGWGGEVCAHLPSDCRGGPLTHGLLGRARTARPGGFEPMKPGARR